MQQAYSWHSSPLLVGGLPVMCVFLTVDFSECALSTSLFISACLSSCQNLFWTYVLLLFDFVCLWVFFYVCMRDRDRERAREREREQSFWLSISNVFFDCVHMLVNVCYHCLLVDRLLFGLLTDSSIKSCCTGNPQWQDATASLGFLHQGLSCT